MPPDRRFWEGLDHLIRELTITIDRPFNSEHPRYPGLIYPLDYGYLASVTAMDGEGLDVWLGRSGEKRVTGIICSADLLKKDVEIKLLIGCTREEMARILSFMDRGDLHPLLITRPAEEGDSQGE